MQKNVFLILIFSCFILTASAQKVAGVYKGYMEVDSPKNTINFELTLKEKKGKLFGYCYRLFVLRDTLYYNLLKVNARINGDVLIVEDEYSVSNNFENNTRGIKTVFFFNLKDIQDTSTVLPGKWNTSAWRNYKSLTGAVNVIREKDYLNTQLYKRLADKKLDQDMAFEETNVDKSDIAIKNNKDKSKNEKLDVVVKNEPTPNKEDKEKTRIKEQDNKNKTINPESDSLKNKSAIAKQEKKENKKTNKTTLDNNKTTKLNTDTIASTVVKSSITDSLSIQQSELSLIQNKDTLKRDYADVRQTINQAKTQTIETKRVSEPVQTLSVFEDSITIALYDNGEIDGDTVSVFVDNKLLLNKIGLGAKAQKFTINVPVGQIVQISLFAETLGTIPPNTGLMVVYSGDQRYQVFFTSTLEKSASVLFRRL
jgi:hypothetical protein